MKFKIQSQRRFTNRTNRSPILPSRINSASKLVNLSLLFSCLLALNYNAMAYNINLGNVDYSNPLNPNQRTDAILAEVIDGTIITERGVSNGFRTSDGTIPSYLRLTLDSVPNTDNVVLQEGETIAYYSFTTSIYYAVFPAQTASEYSISYSIDGGNTFTRFTDYLSTTTNDAGSTLSANAAGTLSATRASGGSDLEVHNLQYRIPDNILDSITHIQYDLPANAGFGNNGTVSISEFSTTLNLEVNAVPETSTYALMLGFISFLYVTIRYRNNKPKT